MCQQRLKPGIRQKHFKRGSGGRVAIKNGSKILLNRTEHRSNHFLIRLHVSEKTDGLSGNPFLSAKRPEMIMAFDLHVDE